MRANKSRTAIDAKVPNRLRMGMTAKRHDNKETRVNMTSTTKSLT